MTVAVAVTVMQLLMVGSLTGGRRGITVGFMKWLLVLSFCVIGCASDEPPTVPGNGTPIPPAMGAGGTGGIGGAGGIGGEGGAGGGAKGACDNESDLDAIDGAEDTLRNIARDCGAFECAIFFGNGFAYESCVNMCVEDQVPELSPDCAACYGGSERCSHDSLCILRCRNDTCRVGCLDCMSLAGCIEELEECSGLPGDGCPDSL
jgi:hypothetical protein